MKSTLHLLNPLVRLTLFTRANCSLCDTAKAVVSQARTKLDVDYEEIDVMQNERKQWRDIYEFDVPVLHVQSNDQATARADGPLKLMHRFTEADIERLAKATKQ